MRTQYMVLRFVGAATMGAYGSFIGGQIGLPVPGHIIGAQGIFCLFGMFLGFILPCLYFDR